MNAPLLGTYCGTDLPPAMASSGEQVWLGVIILLSLFQIRDGGDMNAPLLGTYCGTDLPPAMASSGEQVWLQFMSDFSVANNGFRLEYMTNGRTFYYSFVCC